MIQPSEVRVGNWILFEEDGTEFRVMQILLQGYDVCNEKETTWIEKEYFAGIPLTEEWLERFGFEKGISSFNKNGLVIESNNNAEYLNRALHLKVSYVHQLQNLFYCLTGSELELKQLV